MLSINVPIKPVGIRDMITKHIRKRIKASIKITIKVTIRTMPLFYPLPSHVF